MVCYGGYGIRRIVSTHSHPKVAAWFSDSIIGVRKVSTHSHPKVAAAILSKNETKTLCFNTQPPEGGCLNQIQKLLVSKTVSTHSHPKVAANVRFYGSLKQFGFNTQPPEGGCIIVRFFIGAKMVSTHSHPKVAAPYIKKQEKSAN